MEKTTQKAIKETLNELNQLEFWSDCSFGQFRSGT